ncbi:MAG TPA: coenzyme F420-0:L-glutamate ligase [Xanthobacteraceae bacterium]|jgi:coenzyme F420-0:L-glutamate ligase/coenzyme F420-1:gamma-L-glutamate ligase|nr:coenzyme F420-0:L-glutamate ligase [Xanthobacteraceae bacterium]
MTISPRIELIGVPDFPLVKPGDDLAALIATALERAGLRPVTGDILAVAQKIVSKAEDRFVDLATVQPSERARAIGAEIQKDPRLVEVILGESTRVVRKRPGLLIVEHRLGYVMANAGVDHSNVEAPGGRERVLLLPRDPDASAEALRTKLSARFGCTLAVIVNDSFGRAWRRGTVGVALGAAGLPAALDLRGHPDLFGQTLQTTVVGFADEVAAAASLVMGQAAEGMPVVLVRGLAWDAPASVARTLLRPPAEDLFR